MNVCMYVCLHVCMLYACMYVSMYLMMFMIESIDSTAQAESENEKYEGHISDNDVGDDSDDEMVICVDCDYELLFICIMML